MGLHRERVGPKKPLRHPIMDQGGHGVRSVVGFTAADPSGIGVKTNQQQIGHDIPRDDGLDGSDSGHVYRGGGGKGNDIMKETGPLRNPLSAPEKGLPGGFDPTGIYGESDILSAFRPP